MIECAKISRSWRPAIFNKTELQTSICGVPKNRRDLEKLVINQEKLDTILGLIGLCCNETNLKQPTVGDIFRTILKMKYGHRTPTKK
ncbi:hypothetical protein RvY_02051 [Ramazzottius varieornatus]|uniref:Uncharacterized protein n=1 Tax=Ramazzottius varieornatus TaxID=947166 RepID=A0A1D1UIH3_RAMVA|nr:hypothetical protein RvY_02051 [Ramazzottius varieornatus]